MVQKSLIGCVIGAGLSLASVGIASAATLVVEYNANNAVGSGTTFTIADSAPNAPAGGAISPGQGVTGTAVPEIVQSGGLRDGKYVNFTGLGFLGHSGVQGSDLNTGGLAQGYSMEGFFRFNNLQNNSNTGIGFSQDTGAENQFLFVNSNGTNFQSETQTSTTGGVFQTVNHDLNPFLRPGGNNLEGYFQLVKTVTPPDLIGGPDQNGTIKYYLNGQLVLTTNGPIRQTDTDIYWGRGEDLGNVGQSGREVGGLDYVLTRFYQGVLTDDEIQASYLSTIPEPTMLGAVGAGAMVLMGGRRRRQAGKVRVNRD